ncbi:alpha/beta fold hydrolase [Bradyrhizobium vignae]|uniref:Alpha/beta hydrolase n=1 Tax=Bradyrhizobium vignae TaxID=1549949 RepID=A0ABS3ZXG4_9BRAD|nr:alpha/beta hydrolase [Bradyrhizobium vignae]MBP0112838.1 alpha/beta hydrolase [Bradyrhizobium vignae]
MIKVGGAELECTLHGSGEALVLLANAGCSTGYFDPLAGRLAAGGLQIVAINMRGVGSSTGPLDGVSLQDLAADVAGVIEMLGCAPAHILGHAFGNRVARCLAADRPELVRSLILLAAGGLIALATPLGTAFRNAGEARRTGPECAALGARWLSPASDPNVLQPVECWPQVHIAQIATSRLTPLEHWWTGGTAPMLVVQGLDDDAAPPGNGHALRNTLGNRVTLVDIPQAGHFMLLEQPEPVFDAVRDFIKRIGASRA